MQLLVSNLRKTFCKTAGQVSIAQCLWEPLGFEPVAQKVASDKTEAVGRTGLSVGLLPVLDHAAKWSEDHMQGLEAVLMPPSPATCISPNDPIKREDQFYQSPPTCAFPGPNAAMQALRVDARYSRRGYAGLSCLLLCLIAPFFRI